jgi:hypothetical protein
MNNIFNLHQTKSISSLAPLERAAIALNDGCRFKLHTVHTRQHAAHYAHKRLQNPRQRQPTAAAHFPARSCIAFTANP